MDNAAFQKTINLLMLVMAGMQTAQGLKDATGAQKKDAALNFVRLGEAGIELFKPGEVNHPAIDTAAGGVIDAIVALTHAHADAAQDATEGAIPGQLSPPPASPLAPSPAAVWPSPSGTHDRTRG